MDVERGAGPCDFAFNINDCFVVQYRNNSVNNIEYKLGLPIDIIQEP